MSQNLPAVHHSLDQYMLEVGRVPLLTRQEELELAYKLKHDKDVAAAKKLVASNLRFVVKVAFEYKNYNIRMTDLIQEGNIGLMHAVSKYDPDRGYRLISYAVWWIKAYIQNYIIKNWSMVPVSARRKQLFGRLRGLPSGELEIEPSREIEGLEADAAVEGEGAQYLIPAGQADEPTVGVTRDELMMAQRDFSLDATLSEETGTTYLARLPSTQASAEEDLGSAQVRTQVSQALEKVLVDLDDRGRYILEHRLLADEPISLQEIGEKFDVSRERARQLEARVKDKLKKALAHLGAAEIVN